MKSPGSAWDKVQSWLSPLLYLANNWLSMIGVVLVTTSTILWIFMLPTLVRGHVRNPYVGIVTYMVLPAAFLGGLLVIPVGIYLKKRREIRSSAYPLHFSQIDLRNPSVRRLLLFLGLTTLANLMIGSQLTYSAVGYMETVTFCGKTCHTVMQPEYTAYQNSPHSSVECVQCHIGPGASWFVKSKISGVRQVLAVALKTYSRPIPTPVHDLRPARETCEACHWPQKYGEDRLRVIRKFAADEANTQTKTVLLLRIGGGYSGPGIHGAHLSSGVRIHYAHSDDRRQKIPWVSYASPAGQKTEFLAEGVKPEDVRNYPVREMDCMDCHNRPSHSFDIPERAVDRAMVSGLISAALPFAKKKAIEVLKREYKTQEQAAKEIPEQIHRYYRETYPAIYSSRLAEVSGTANAVLAAYSRNVFPDMGVTWGVYPNNIGHEDFPGCTRCHDEKHVSQDGRKILNDCNTCHSLLAMEETAPKILSELGVPEPKVPQLLK